MVLGRCGVEPIRVRHYVREAAIRQKIDTLGGWREAQARDVFDLHVLGSGISEESLLVFLAGGLSPSRLEEALKRALEVSYEEFAGQVLEFLENDARSRYSSPGQWDDIRIEVPGLIERVLKLREES